MLVSDHPLDDVLTRQDRKAGTYRPIIALNIATASLTIIYELIWLPGRFILRGQLTSLVTEAAITTILWALWIGAPLPSPSLPHSHCVESQG